MLLKSFLLCSSFSLQKLYAFHLNLFTKISNICSIHFDGIGIFLTNNQSSSLLCLIKLNELVPIEFVIRCFDKIVQPNLFSHKFVKHVYYSHCDGKGEGSGVLLVKVLTNYILVPSSRTRHQIFKTYLAIKS